MFPVTLTLTANNEAELREILARNTGSLPAVVKAAGLKTEPDATGSSLSEAKAAVTAKKQEAAKKEDTAATQSTAPADAAPEQKGGASASVGGDTIDDAKALTMKIVADKGRDAAVKLLTEYEVAVAAKLPADKIDAFCADARKVLAS